MNFMKTGKSRNLRGRGRGSGAVGGRDARQGGALRRNSGRRRTTRASRGRGGTRRCIRGRSTRSDPRLLVVLDVEQVRHHHQAELRVLVRLRAVKFVPVEHRHRTPRALPQPVEGLEVGDRVDAAAADGVVVPRHRADEDDARVVRRREVGEELREQQELREEVDLHLLLVAVDRPLRHGERRLVDRGVADQPVERLRALPLLELVAEVAHRLERRELDVHRREQRGSKPSISATASILSRSRTAPTTW